MACYMAVLGDIMKLCFFCTHCEFTEAFAYSELTWESGAVSCGLGNWHIYGPSDNELPKLGEYLQMAETCKDYTPRKGCS